MKTEERSESKIFLYFLLIVKISTKEREDKRKKIKAAKTNMTSVVLVTPKRDKLLLSSDLTLINRIFGLGNQILA